MSRTLVRAANFEFVFAQVKVNLKQSVGRTTKEGTKEGMNEPSLCLCPQLWRAGSARWIQSMASLILSFQSTRSTSLEVHSLVVSLTGCAGTEEMRVFPLSARCTCTTILFLDLHIKLAGV